MAGVITRAAALALAALLAPPAAAQAPAAATAQPARWHLDGATNRCVLTRRLEGTPGAATFVLRTIPGSHHYDVILAGQDLAAKVRRGGRQARIGFGSGAGSGGGTNSFRDDATPIDLPGELGRGVVMAGFPPALIAQFGRATSLSLADARGGEIGTWTLPLAARAAQALAECEVAKQVEWGADPAGFEPGATPPQPLTDPRTWVSTRDFNMQTMLASAAYTAVFRLVLDPAGQPTACTLLEFVGNVDIKDDFCRVVMHSARFRPASDARGNPIASVAVNTISFRMETEIQIGPG